MESTVEIIKSDCKHPHGGGSRYREDHRVPDLTTEEQQSCTCWLCRERNRHNLSQQFLRCATNNMEQNDEF